MPQTSGAAASASTMRCRWSICTENWVTRRALRLDWARARASCENTACDLSDGTPARARRVTCTGYRPSCGGRGTCGGPGRDSVGLRPAPARRPPQVRGAGRSSCFDRWRPISIRQQSLSAAGRTGCPASRRRRLGHSLRTCPSGTTVEGGALQEGRRPKVINKCHPCARPGNSVTDHPVRSTSGRLTSGQLDSAVIAARTAGGRGLDHFASGEMDFRVVTQEARVPGPARRRPELPSHQRRPALGGASVAIREEL
jgi:hypothetical protein